MLSVLDRASFDRLWQPELIVAAVLLGIVYLVGTGPAAARRRGDAPYPLAQRLSFVMGLVVLYGGVGSPLDLLADRYLFSAHMLQHMFITMAAPPLLLAGTPAGLLRPLVRHRWIAAFLRTATRPVVAIVVFNVVFSGSHAPVIYDLTLRSGLVHFAEHAVFLITAVFMWWPILSPLPEFPRLAPPAQLLYLFVDGIAMTPVFALVTFSSRVLYAAYNHTPDILGMTALQDQQLGGVMMKTAAAIAYGAAFVAAFYRWAASERATSGRIDPIVGGGSAGSARSPRVVPAYLRPLPPGTAAEQIREPRS